MAKKSTKIIKKPQGKLSELFEKTKDVSKTLDEVSKDLDIYYNDIAVSDNPKEFEEQIEISTNSLKETASFLGQILINIKKISDELQGRYEDLKFSKSKKTLIRHPSNGIIDIEESKPDYFAKGLNIYKLLLIFIIGSFAGVMIELLWCLITRGYIESRSGLVYGPFNLLYGFGAVCLTVALYKYRNRSKKISFIGGMIIGGTVEYLCSFLQELVFGSRSWDYSNMPFNINGRICLLYTVFWGFLGVLWIKSIYPLMSQLILKLPNKVGKIITIVLSVFLLFNAVVSGVAVLRWSERQEGTESKTVIGEFIDERFPDSRMEKIYANMKFN